MSPVALLEGYRLIAGFDTGTNHEKGKEKREQKMIRQKQISRGVPKPRQFGNSFYQTF